MKRFFLNTTGCKANQWDSYVIAAGLQKAGLIHSPIEMADLIIINACTLTEGAEKDIRRFINTCRKKNIDAKIVIAGCHGQVYPEKDFGVEIVLGHREKFHLLDFIEDKGHFVGALDGPSIEEARIDGMPTGRTRFFFKIQDGCDRFCRYCVVPYARGRPVSRPASEIIKVLRQLKEMGVKEVVLTGIEIASYKDEGSGLGLTGLIQQLEDVDTPERIRLSSIDPMYIDAQFIKAIANSKKMARSLHIALQSGSDKVLEMMGRGYKKDLILEIVRELNREIEDIGIGMDVITGLPGEDQDLFMETLRLIESLEIYYLHVFPFSPRRYTEAAAMDGQCPEVTKRSRVNELKRLDREKRLSFYKRTIGKERCIIPEGKQYRGLYMKGLTEEYIPVYIPYKRGMENRFIRVKITEIKDGMPIGMVIGEG